MQPSPPAEPVPDGPGQPVAPYPYGHRPTTPRTLGTLSIVFSAFVIFSCLLTVVLPALRGLTALPGHAEVDAAMDNYERATRIPMLIRNVMYIVMSVWLIGIGVGQRRYRAWAVRQSVRWGIVALVFVAGNLALTFALMPMLARTMEELHHAHGSANPFAMVSGAVGSPVGLVVAAIFKAALHAPYPIILIVAFRKPSIVNAMAT